MPACAILTCKVTSNFATLTKGGISYHRFPKDPPTKKIWIEATGKVNWVPTKWSTICSQHFRENDFITKTSGNKYLKDGAVPSINIVRLYSQTRDDIEIEIAPARRDSEDNRSVTPITDPEDEEEEAEISTQIDIKKEYSIVIQDPLSQSNNEGSFKQLHSHHPGLSHSQLYVQPSTSTSELVIKEEIDEDMMDYRSMYYKLLDELAELKNQQHDQEKQALIETNKSLGKEMENLIATNTKYVNDMQNLMNENQKLKEKNQSLADNIRHLSDKIQELTAKNEENQTKERVDIFNDYIEKIEQLNEKIRSLAEDNKSLIERNKSLAESVRKYSEESQNFKMKNKMQTKFIQRLKNNCNNKLETKSKVIKVLRHNLFRLKAVNARLQRPHVAVQS